MTYAMLCDEGLCHTGRVRGTAITNTVSLVVPSISLLPKPPLTLQVRGGVAAEEAETATGSRQNSLFFFSQKKHMGGFQNYDPFLVSLLYYGT